MDNLWLIIEMAIEIVSFPSKNNDDFPYAYVSLPEGN